ncbi:MAG: RHS repeat-associated core domain-containing protein [Gammaproteobacteria bacterium]|nr:MAG: RHS repeat-associated core domain-containing protein [Gammaproteobacteria bacterium]
MAQGCEVVESVRKSAPSQGRQEGRVTRKTASIPKPLRFPGQYHDPETGLYRNTMRDYDPELGRYLQRDPIGLAGGLNVYGYAYQNPVSYYDVSGLNPGAAAGCAVGGVGGPVGCGIGAAVGFVLNVVAAVYTYDTLYGDSNETPGLTVPDDLLPPRLEPKSCEVQVTPNKPFSKPPSDKERCIQGVQFSYALCKSSGTNRIICEIKRAIAMAGCLAKESDGGDSE